MTQGSVVVGEQFSASIRNIAILLLLSRQSDPRLTAALMVTFTSTQMVASLGFATVGEPAMLAPKAWVTGGGLKTVQRGGLTFAGIAVATTCFVGLLMGLDPLMAGTMATLAAVMAWVDVERVLHFLLGCSLVPLVRNILICIIGISMTIANVQTGLAVVILAMTWCGATALSRCPRPTRTADRPSSSWPGRRPATTTGIIDICVSYLVIQGILFLTIALFGPLMVGPLRLAQSFVGPVQMMASGLRSALTMRGSSLVPLTPKRLIWFISPFCAFLMVVFAFVLPSGLARLLVGDQWLVILHIVPALAVQSSLVSIGAIGAARLRLMGYYHFVSGLRIGSAALSLAGFWIFARLWETPNLGFALIGLSVGPIISAPFWIYSKRG